MVVSNVREREMAFCIFVPVMLLDYVFLCVLNKRNYCPVWLCKMREREVLLYIHISMFVFCGAFRLCVTVCMDLLSCIVV